MHTNCDMELLKVCVVFSLLVGLAMSRGGRAKTDVPVVTAVFGQGVVIPCSTRDPPTRISGSRIYWQGSNPRRSKNPKKDSEVMLVYNGGKVEDHLQTPLYRNRTSLFPDRLRHGNFSLKIDPVKTEDNQTRVVVQYEKRPSSFEPICQAAIRVTARYQKPAVNLSCTQRAGLVEVTCDTQGGFPEPIVNWSLQNHTLLHSQEVERTVKPDPRNGTFIVHLTVLLNASEGQTFTCFVTNPALQETLNTSVTIQGCEGNVSDPDPMTTNWIVVVAVLVLVAVSVAAFITIGRRYLFTGCQNQAPGDSSVSGTNPETQELQV
ncbi:CD276 antigen-like [Anguilla anguilla]|uniref:CD276 antigen-like n=1 Tax=Anguilla anguilla TaxID=7936 RepID=UPI0015A77AA1|nr:CD276 antigen-like [Anguilla anguilla]